MDTVSSTLVTTLKDTGKVGAAGAEAVTHVATGVIHGVHEVGSDLGAAAKGTIIGVLRGTQETGAQALTTIGHTSSSFIKTTAQMGGDLGTSAKALEGLLQKAQNIPRLLVDADTQWT